MIKWVHSKDKSEIFRYQYCENRISIYCSTKFHVSFQVLKANGETDKRRLEDELDSLRARVMQLERQSSTKQETISMLQSTVQTYESKIQILEKEISDKSSQVEMSRRTNDRCNLEIDKANLENSSLRQENE